MPKKPSVFLRLYFIISGALLLGACLYLSTDGKFLSSLLPKPAKKYPSIGFIESSEGDTRIRSAGELLWVPANINDAIRDNDSVFTGSNGKMNIILDPNTRLQVNKDSLFKVSKKTHLTIIELIQGEMRTTSSNNDLIKFQHNEKSKILKLSEVETKLSADALNILRTPVAPPNTLELMEALDEGAEDTSSPTQQTYTHNNELQQIDSADVEAHSRQKDIKVLNQEGNRKILWMLGIAYTIFSFIALKEVIHNKGMPS